MEYRQLLPQPGTVDVSDLLAGLDLDPGTGDRPYTVVNFIVSADGRATVAGHSGPLGDDGDRAMFHGLRERADAVMAGTGTLRTERYGRILGKEERRRRRSERGLPAEPLACILTRSGDVPLEIPLFAEPEARVVVFAPGPLDTSSVAAQVEVVELDVGELTVTTALRRLRADFGVRSLLCEGGPTLFGAMLHERVVDELFLTLAPKLSGGGGGPAIATGPELSELQRLDLRWLLERDGALYLRYALTRD